MRTLQSSLWTCIVIVMAKSRAWIYCYTFSMASLVLLSLQVYRHLDQLRSDEAEVA